MEQNISNVAALSDKSLSGEGTLDSSVPEDINGYGGSPVSRIMRALLRSRPIPADRLHFPNLKPVVCKLTSDGAIVVLKQSLADLSFGPEGLGSIIVDNRGLYFRYPSGKTAAALIFDNGPDYVVVICQDRKKWEGRLY
ncbi:MAG: hypothetical protein J2P21_19395 [Chloracidobacterium sp.]|nr:hypothetical protein [Chloracidobacterium sp.]